MKTVPKLKDYRNKVLMQYYIDTVAIYRAYDISALQLEPLVVALENCIADMDTVFMVDKRNKATNDIESLDARRDAAIVGIRKLVESYETHYNATYREASQLILERMDRFGSRIAKMNYLVETQVISSIVNDCETHVPMQAAITLLHATEWVAELKEANIGFNELFLLRNADIAQQPKKNILTLRAEAVPVFEELIHTTEAFYITLKKTEYLELMKQMDALSKQCNNTVPKGQRGDE
ncbi:MAG: DUF6261 family protein [Bacteroidota bacterium]